MEQVEAGLQKSGENVIVVGLQRHLAGIRVSIRAVPLVEDFFRSFGSGDQQPVSNHGRHWLSVGQPLRVWDLVKSPGLMLSEDETRFRIDRPGQPLVEPDPNVGPNTILNTSFIRLVGISEGDGVSFTIKGAMTLEEMRRLAERIKLANRRLYISYMRPVSINVFVSTQEVRK